jgi:hypothetical protein
MNSTNTNQDTDMDKNKEKSSQRPISKIREVEVDASTLIVISVAALLLPLLLAGFFR